MSALPERRISPAPKLSAPLLVILLLPDIVRLLSGPLLAQKSVPLLSNWRVWVSEAGTTGSMVSKLPESILVMPPGAAALPIVPPVQELDPERISVPPPSMTPLPCSVRLGMVMVMLVG